MQPDTRYAKSGDIHIAYQVFGDGPVNLVIAPPFVSNVEIVWERPEFSRWLLRIASYVRVAIFDKRGTGMSDRVSGLPGLDQRIDDLGTVMDDAKMDQAALLGISEGGPLATLFAATYPDRCRALVLFGSFARGVPRGKGLDWFLNYIEQSWGSGGAMRLVAPSCQDNPVMQDWWGRWERLGASPAAAADLVRMNSQIDITDILPTIRVPTLVIHRTGDSAVKVECGRFLAERIA